MSITTYSELQTAISNWMKRTELGDGGADEERTSEFIALTEAWLNRELRTRQMEARSRAAFTGEYLALPTDFQSMRDLELIADPKRKIPYLTPTQIDAVYPHGQTGEPLAYSIVGDQFEFRPITDTERTVEIAYYQTIPALSDSNTTNWLLTAAPDIYLFGARAHADSYFADYDPAQSIWWPSFAGAVENLQAAELRGRYPSGGLTMRSVVSGR